MVEGIYSMEGEIGNLSAIVAVAKKYKVPQQHGRWHLISHATLFMYVVMLGLSLCG